jgi:hypothetical protein
MYQQVWQLSESSKTLVASFFLFRLKVDFYSIGASAAGWKEVAASRSSFCVASQAEIREVREIHSLANNIFRVCVTHLDWSFFSSF